MRLLCGKTISTTGQTRLSELDGVCGGRYSGHREYYGRIADRAVRTMCVRIGQRCVRLPDGEHGVRRWKVRNVRHVGLLQGCVPTQNTNLRDEMGNRNGRGKCEVV